MGLAPKIVDEVFRVIEEIRASGTTLVLEEHNPRPALLHRCQELSMLSPPARAPNSLSASRSSPLRFSFV
jgi:hypothetical protein